MLVREAPGDRLTGFGVSQFIRLPVVGSWCFFLYCADNSEISDVDISTNVLCFQRKAYVLHITATEAPHIHPQYNIMII